MTQINDNLLLAFKKPLDHITDEKVKQFKKRSSKNATRNIIIGTIAIVLLTILHSNEFMTGSSSGRLFRNGPSLGAWLGVGGFSFLVYGALQLITLRNRTTDYARQELLQAYPELQILEDERLKKLEDSRSNSRKIIALSLIGLIVLFSTVLFLM